MRRRGKTEGKSRGEKQKGKAEGKSRREKQRGKVERKSIEESEGFKYLYILFVFVNRKSSLIGVVNPITCVCPRQVNEGEEE